MSRYRLFGLELASDFPFASELAPGSRSPRPPDLTFACAPTAPPLGGERPRPVFSSPETTPSGESIASFLRGGGWDVLHFAGVADFYLGGGRIDGHLLDPRSRLLVELRLLGPVIAYWLERDGLPVLHASVVAVDGRAVAFLSGSRGGKSALAASLMAAGHPLLCDDLLAVERTAAGGFRARAGYPTMRLWPAEADRFLGDHRPLPRVHPGYEKRRVAVGPGGFGAFCGEARPLARLYFPERQDRPAGGGIRLQPVTPRDAVILFARGSFVARLAAAAGLQDRRLETFARLAERVPVRRLVYPSGLDELPRVRDAVLADLAD